MTVEKIVSLASKEAAWLADKIVGANQYGNDAAGLLRKYSALEVELAALKQELQALREQKPVAYIEYSDDKRQSWYLVYSKSKDRQQEPLYAAPVPASERFVECAKCGNRNTFLYLNDDGSYPTPKEQA